MSPLPRDFDSGFVVNAMDQLFSTQNGVYCVVFNMKDLCSAAALNISERSLSELVWVCCYSHPELAMGPWRPTHCWHAQRPGTVSSVQGHNLIQSRLSGDSRITAFRSRLFGIPMVKEA